MISRTLLFEKRAEERKLEESDELFRRAMKKWDATLAFPFAQIWANGEHLPFSKWIIASPSPALVIGVQNSLFEQDFSIKRISTSDCSSR